MPLDPQAQAMQDAMTASGRPPMHTLSVAQARQALAAVTAMRPPPEPVHHVEDREIAGSDGEISLRLYIPEGQGPFPLLVFAHGGGWMLGDLNTADPICRTLSNLAPCITVSVDYRLAPEHQFPAALEDFYTAVTWVADHAAELGGDPTRLAVGGESAGGNLAAAAALMARDRGGPRLTVQLLINPPTDDPEAGSPSMQAYGGGPGLSRADLTWFFQHYVTRETDRHHPYCLPLRASDLHGVPPALVVTAECDPLRDEGEAYAARLREAGVAVTSRRYPGMMHGFTNFASRLDQGKVALVDAAAALRTAFTQP
jgi:acetyl esterase